MGSRDAVIRLFFGVGITVSMMTLTISSTGATTELEESLNPRTAMIDVLSASGPHPSLGAEARVFDRFVGTWDCAYTSYRDDGTTKHAKGELEFGWILDGRAIQDIWIAYAAEPGKERSIGTTVRFFDSRSKTWRIIYVGPGQGALMDMKGGLEGDRIVLRGVNDDGAMLRWSFNDITSDSFTWRGEKSRDGGKSWKLEEGHHMQEATFFASAPGQAITYQIGKLQIVKFLADAKRLQGPKFSLRAFHDFVWKNGNVPIALQRWEYLGLEEEIQSIDEVRATRYRTRSKTY